MEVLRGQYRQQTDDAITKGNIQDLDSTSVLNDTSVLNNLQDGQLSEVVTLKDGSKAKLQRSGNNVNVYKAKDVLEVPHEFWGEKLTTNQRTSLINGNTILLKKGKSNLYLKIDHDTNAIVVRGDRDFKMPKVIGDNQKFKYNGYELTDMDRVLLANGHKTEQKLLCGEQGFFLAEIKLTTDNKGIEFSNISSMSVEEAKNYIAAAANQKESAKNDVIQQERTIKNNPGKEQVENNHVEEKVVSTKVMDTPIIQEEKFKEATQQTESANINKETVQTEKVNTPILDEQFLGAIKENDWIKVNDLAKSGYVPSSAVLEKINDLNPEKKTAVEKIFNLEKTKVERAKVVEQREEQSKANHKGSIKQAVTTLFNGM